MGQIYTSSRKEASKFQKFHINTNVIDMSPIMKKNMKFGYLNYLMLLYGVQNVKLA